MSFWLAYLNRESVSEKDEIIPWRRIAELAAAVIVILFLVLISRLETRLYEISESLARNKEFINTIVYFALINVNVILVCILSFLIFRNLIKLVVERRRGYFGSKLRSKLVMAFVLFAVAPSIILFYVSAQFITASFERWFSENVKNTMNQTREVGAQVYSQTEKRLENVARTVLQRVDVVSPKEYFEPGRLAIDQQKLQGLEQRFGLDLFSVVNNFGTVLFLSGEPDQSENQEENQLSGQTIQDFLRQFQQEITLEVASTVVQDGQSDRVVAAAAIRSPWDSSLVGMVVVEEKFEFQILRSMEAILAEFGSLRPSAELARISFMILMLVITLLVIFAATWLGFYVARGITGPIRVLADATREVALGNYQVSVRTSSHDETGQLIEAFNKMIQDLQRHQEEAEEARSNLQGTNAQLEGRKNYIEIILKHITAGVISVDANLTVTSVNNAAERLLSLESRALLGRNLQEVVRKGLWEDFFKVILERLQQMDFYNHQFDLKAIGIDEDIVVDATRTYDEQGRNLGIVMVFDDASKKLTAGRVAAWREVARRIAHEIKNPLTPIKLNSERLLRRYHDRFQGEDREVFHACLDSILGQVDSLRNLVNEFSKFSRLPTVKLSPGDLHGVIRDVVNTYKMSYPEVDFDLEGLEPVPEIMLDQEQFKRVIINLLTNAIAAGEDIPEPTRLRILTHYDKLLGMVRLQIIDNGCGIPEALRERVLEPYFSTKDGGTGLGLAIVNQIVSDHGGYLRLQSHTPRGTIVVIELPV